MTNDLTLEELTELEQIELISGFMGDDLKEEIWIKLLRAARRGMEDQALLDLLRQDRDKLGHHNHNLIKHNAWLAYEYRKMYELLTRIKSYPALPMECRQMIADEQLKQWAKDKPPPRWDEQPAPPQSDQPE
jgi:hypothetical protein